MTAPTNERLRSAVTSAGFTYETLAEHLGVDPKTVQRWITVGRVPHRTHRLRVAEALGNDDSFLWPSTASDPLSRSASQAELVTIYQNRGSVPVDLWLDLIGRAEQNIDILAFAATFLSDALPDAHELIRERALAGVQVRFLLGRPDSDSVRQRGNEEGIGDLLSSRCALSWSHVKRIADTAGIEARAHDTTLYASMFRFDNVLLANHHLWGAPAAQSPVLHLARIPGGRLFTNHMASYERIWDQAQPYPA